MAKTIKDLFAEKQKVPKKTELYGLAGTVFIESRGIIGPARVAALAVSSPNPIADLIGSQLNGFIGGNANRPDDTIFKNNKPFTKPITFLRPTQALIRDAVEADTQYYIKSNPFPGNLISGFVAALSNPSALVSLGATAVNKLGSKTAIKNLASLLKKKGDQPGYGPRWVAPNRTQNPKNFLNEYVKSSTHYTLFKPKPATQAGGAESYGRFKNDQSEVVKRDKTKMVQGMSPFDAINDSILKSLPFDVTDGDVQSSIKADSKEFENLDYTGYTYVAIKLYGKNTTIVLPGAISGISEDYAPEINNFKYVGSPFSLYKYGGVERSIKFELKMYALSYTQDVYLRYRLDQLRKLVYPDQDINVVTYASSEAYSPMYFSPNLIELSIRGLYSNVLGIVDSLSIEIDDEVPWASPDFIGPDEPDSDPRPILYNIGFSMKVIDMPSVTKTEKGARFNFDYSDEENNKYVNYFTGYSLFNTDSPRDIGGWAKTAEELKAAVKEDKKEKKRQKIASRKAKNKT